MVGLQTLQYRIQISPRHAQQETAARLRIRQQCFLSRSGAVPFCEFVREVADAYDFHLVGSEVLNGRDAWVISGEPRAGFQPHSKEAQILSKFHGRLWIDKGELQLAKMDVEALDAVSFGWVLARIHKGTRLVFDQTRVNGEVWLPQHLSFKFDARVALFKGYNEQDEESYSDYKKFRATTKIVGIGDMEK